MPSFCALIINNPKCFLITLLVFLAGVIPMIYMLTQFQSTFWVFEDVDNYIQDNPFCSKNSSSVLDIKPIQYQKYRCEDSACNGIFVNNVDFTDNNLDGQTFCIPYKKSIGVVVNRNNILAFLACTDITVRINSSLRIEPFTDCYNLKNRDILFSHTNSGTIIFIVLLIVWVLCFCLGYCMCFENSGSGTYTTDGDGP